MEDQSLFSSSEPIGISEGLQNFINAMVEEIVLEDKPFDTQKKYLKKFSENEGLDYEAIEKAVTELTETLAEMKSSDSKTLLRLAVFQAKECYVTEAEVIRIAESLKNQKNEMANRTLFLVKQNGLYGYIDVNGNMVIKPCYSYAHDFKDDVTVVVKNRELFLINRGGEEVAMLSYVDVAQYFSEGLCQFKDKSGKHGFFDKSGAVAIDPRFDYVGDFHDGIAGVTINGKMGAVDKNGIMVIKPQFDFICDFEDGLALAELDGKWGVINKMGEFVVKPHYDDNIYYQYGKYLKCSEGLMPNLVVVGERIVKHRQGLFHTEKEKISIPKYGFIDRNGNLVIEHRFDFAYPFSEGLAHVWIDGKSGFIDKTGEYVVNPNFDDAASFSEGLASVRFGDWENGKYGYIDKAGQMVIEDERFCDCKSFVEGLAAVRVDRRRLEWGFIDKTGQMVIAQQFESFSGFHNGLCRVTWNDDTEGYINRSGEVVFKES